MRTSELTGAALDWAVAKCWGEVAIVNGTPWLVTGGLRYVQQRPFNPSTNWAQGGPIIEREKIDLKHHFVCVATIWDRDDIGQDDLMSKATGHTPLIAAMRCYVASKLGDEIEIPKELL